MDIQALYRHHHRILQTKTTQKTVSSAFLGYGDFSELTLHIGQDLYGTFKLHYAIFAPVHNPGTNLTINLNDDPFLLV